MNRRQFARRSSALFLLASAVGTRIPLAQAGSYEDWFDACKKNDARVIRSLLQRGFDVNAIEPERGDTGLILALREDAMDVFRVLLAHPDLNLEARAKNGDNALMIASWRGNLPAVQAMVDKGAEINRPGWTPLHYAAGNGHLQVISYLLENAAYIDAESPNRTTPLMMAAWRGHIMAVKLLLDEGADASLRNDRGMDVIDFARDGQHPDIVQGLEYRLGKGGAR